VSEYRKELVSPSGEKYVSTSAVETNDLIYGSGYREVDEAAGDSTNDTAGEPSEQGTDANFYGNDGNGGEMSP
jgi:hypothetical protein